MKLYITTFFSLIAIFSQAQIFTHPTTGIANENVGACEQATCTGIYTDNGGLLGNYSNNINLVYRVFCPNTAGNCVRLTFTSFAMEGMVDPAGPNPLDCYFDYLTIGNGATQNSPVIDQAPSSAASTTGRICGTPAVPFTYTSTSANGCLSVRQTSDGTTTGAGWSATITCVPCAGGPTGTDNNDCTNATALCSSAPVGTNASGPGLVAEGCTGTVCPAGGENHSNWYTFTAQTTGTLNVTISPVTGTDDYDYAIYGPGATCASLGTPLRCSDSGSTGVTGTSAAAADVSEDVLGDKFTSQLNVVAGQTFIMMVDEWTPNTGGGYTLSFGGTASLDCTVLPVELLKFDATYLPKEESIDVYWITETENNNDFFDLEKSYDGENFQFVKRVDGQGTTPYETQYFVNDPETKKSTIYYRLKQTDLDGKVKYSRLTSVNVLPELNNELYMYPNPTKDAVNITFSNKEIEEYTMLVLDSKGFVLEERIINAIPGLDNNAEVDLSNHEKGIYYVSVSNNTRRLSGKIIKL